jgi:hypothetical protein
LHHVAIIRPITRVRFCVVDGARKHDHARIATTFEQVAALLEQQDASAHRVRAWREAAAAIRDHDREMSDVFRDHGRVGLEAVPRVGSRLANVVIELVKTGHCGALDRLRGDGLEALKRVPSIGPKLAERIHHDLGVETLEELEAAAHDGRLEAVEGFGPRRTAVVRDVLATRLGRGRPAEAITKPSVATLLEIDREYRRAAAAGELRRIAPRRFNPKHEAWLPVLHLDRDGWSFTALFSNTALAHDLQDRRLGHRPLHEPHQTEGQPTIVTEWRAGCAAGVVRGREADADHYRPRRLRPP